MGVFWDKSTCSPFQPSHENFHSKDFSLPFKPCVSPWTGGALVSTVTWICCFKRCGPEFVSDTVFEGAGPKAWEAPEARAPAGANVPARTAKTSAVRSPDALLLVCMMSLLRITTCRRRARQRDALAFRKKIDKPSQSAARLSSAPLLAPTPGERRDQPLFERPQLNFG